MSVTPAEDGHCTRELVRLLACWRVQTGLTRTEVAQRMGTTRAVVARIEEEPEAEARQMATYQRYARAIGLPLNFALDLPPGGLTVVAGTEQGGTHARYQHRLPTRQTVTAHPAGDPCQV